MDQFSTSLPTNDTFGHWPRVFMAGGQVRTPMFGAAGDENLANEQSQSQGHVSAFEAPFEAPGGVGWLAGLGRARWRRRGRQRQRRVSAAGATRRVSGRAAGGRVCEG